MSKPVLSIVIANYNFGRFLEEAIKSVVIQNVSDKVELIICDGGSTDNSIEIIKKYANGLPPKTMINDWQASSNSGINTSHQHLVSWWCSEHDKGQSDAFNKGFSHASGKYGCWLNADDLLMPGALNKVIHFLESHPEAEWVGGSSIFADSNLKVIWCSRCVDTWNIWREKIPYYSVNGPSSFFLIDKLRQVGGFDLSLNYTMDIDLWRKFVVTGMPLVHIPDYIWCFRVHEASKTSHRFITGRSENAFAVESRLLNSRYGITKLNVIIGKALNRLFRLMKGAYVVSYIDTIRFKGRFIGEV